MLLFIHKASQRPGECQFNKCNNKCKPTALLYLFLIFFCSHLNTSSSLLALINLLNTLGWDWWILILSFIFHFTEEKLKQGSPLGQTSGQTVKFPCFSGFFVYSFFLPFHTYSASPVPAAQHYACHHFLDLPVGELPVFTWTVAEPSSSGKLTSQSGVGLGELSVRMSSARSTHPLACFPAIAQHDQKCLPSRFATWIN